jgi:uncharacterized membrane protein YuzA (DUF378 family)
MKALNLITLALAIIGGLNWGLVALGGYDMDVVANIFGGADTAGARIVYGLVGLSALWQILPWSKALRLSEDRAEAGHATPRAMS